MESKEFEWQIKVGEGIEVAVMLIRKILRIMPDVGG